MNVFKLARGRGLLTAAFSCSVAALGTVAMAGAETASATAATIAVNTCSGEIRAVAPKDIEYSPLWGGVTSEGAYVVIEKVEHAGMFNAVTSTVITCAAAAVAVGANAAGLQ